MTSQTSDDSELRRLLSLVVFRAHYNAVDGLDAFRNLLRKDWEGVVLSFLQGALKSMAGEERAGIVYVIAEHYREKGDIDNLRRLYAMEHSDARASVLNALWGKGGNAEMAEGIVALAVEAAGDPWPAVRTQSCSVLQNQSSWKVDVSQGLEPLLGMLNDCEFGVRRQAAFAAGNLAKRRQYDMSPHLARIAQNLTDKDRFVQDASAWALWQMSRFNHDIGPAIPGLARLLATPAIDDWGGPFKNAAGALLHHARKSEAGARFVRENVCDVSLAPTRKDWKRFLDQLAEV